MTKIEKMKRTITIYEKALEEIAKGEVKNYNGEPNYPYTFGWNQQSAIKALDEVLSINGIRENHSFNDLFEVAQ